MKEVSKIKHKAGSFGCKLIPGCCLCFRDHWLQRWVHIMSHTPTALNMYEDKSFMRDPNLNKFLIEILGSLNEFTFDVEASLVKGVKLT